MKIDIICVGRLKEDYLREAAREYEKRLSRYCKLQILEVADEKTIEDASDAMAERIRSLEAERLKKHLREEACLITLEIAGREMSSEAFAGAVEQLKLQGTSHLQFVIGGSIGLHNSIIKQSKWHLSFSQMTFPHQLMRIILLEQLYRSFRINAGEPYHK
ncbi:MAG: 23S rRNA (pseudouridine(1915)-N(3))-methyltransferase RlmH [Lachnospiraceae bacterium]|nr:23S rRNA (pseudouridine(1915)-N(3))-methyltransferase RlmH [Lachnospiraceae bacterium]